MGAMEVVVEGAGAKKIKQDFWGTYSVVFT
jgi:hypothetical protein